MKRYKKDYYERNTKRDTVFAILIAIPILIGIYALISKMYIMIAIAAITGIIIWLLTELIEILDNIKENTECLRNYIERKGEKKSEE